VESTAFDWIDVMTGIQKSGYGHWKCERNVANFTFSLATEVISWQFCGHFD
jgi:hypothetical protein